MGAVFFVGFMINLLIIGLPLLILGILGIILFPRTAKKGESFGVPFTVISVLVTIVSLVMVMIPIGVFGFFIHMNSMPPDGYVDTGIMIEENGYQDTRFTADGVVYVDLGFDLHYSAEDGEAVFSYREEGFMKGTSYGNYYRLENQNNFDLVSGDRGGVFCPEEDREEILSYYTDEDESVWFYENDVTMNPRPVTNERMLAMQKLAQFDTEGLTVEDIKVEDYRWATVMEFSSDRLLIKKIYPLIVSEDVVYLQILQDDTDSFDNILKGIPLPKEIGEGLIDICN